MLISDQWLILVWIAIQIPFLVRVIRARPAKEISAKYSRSTLVQSRIPLMKSWRSKIDPGDIGVFQKYRRRFFMQYGVFLVSITLLYIFLYLKHM